MRRRPLILILAVGSLSAERAPAQLVSPNVIEAGSDTRAANFIAEARRGTARYRDRSVAIADGYRMVGPDLPSMGEHWLNIALILADSVDAAHPPVLIYVSTPTGPELAGAAYTRLLTSDQSYPDFPRGLHAWHDHSGFIEDEALPMSHVMHGARATANGIRLGVLHLWMWQANPAGEWTSDNWALPFVRAGVRAPSATDAAARALALTADGGRYYVTALSATAHLDSREQTEIAAVFASGADEVRSVSLTTGVEPTPDQLERLREIWQSLWPRIENKLSPDAAAHIEELRQLWW